METFFFFQKISSTRFFSLRISHPPFCTRAPVPFYFLSLIIINLEVLRPIRKPLYTVPLSFHPQKKIGVVVVSQNQPKQKKPLSPCNELLSLPPSHSPPPPQSIILSSMSFFFPFFFYFFLPAAKVAHVQSVRPPVLLLKTKHMHPPAHTKKRPVLQKNEKKTSPFFSPFLFGSLRRS